MIRMDSVLVRKDRIIVEVVLEDARRTYTTPALIKALLPDYPFLLEHTCVNEKGTTFGAVANNTSLPHLLEHMVIEEQVRLEGQAQDQDGLRPNVYVGKTSWLDCATPRARIEVSYANDLIALHAFRIALERLNAAVVE